jgi:hypothetical protein
MSFDPAEDFVSPARWLCVLHEACSLAAGPL